MTVTNVLGGFGIIASREMGLSQYRKYVKWEITSLHTLPKIHQEVIVDSLDSLAIYIQQ